MTGNNPGNNGNRRWGGPGRRGRKSAGFPAGVTAHRADATATPGTTNIITVSIACRNIGVGIRRLKRYLVTSAGIRLWISLHKQTRAPIAGSGIIYVGNLTTAGPLTKGKTVDLAVGRGGGRRRGRGGQEVLMPQSF